MDNFLDAENLDLLAFDGGSDGYDEFFGKRAKERRELKKQLKEEGLSGKELRGKVRETLGGTKIGGFLDDIIGKVKGQVGGGGGAAEPRRRGEGAVSYRTGDKGGRAPLPADRTATSTSGGDAAEPSGGSTAIAGFDIPKPLLYGGAVAIVGAIAYFALRK